MKSCRAWWVGLLVGVGCSSDPGTPPGSGEVETPPVTSRVLVRQEEASREACAYGGVQVRSGVDGNGDGVLDEAEVLHTSLVCYPAPPPAPEQAVSRVRVEPVARGEACAEGGTRVLSGLDADRNGTLDDAEVQRRDVICRERLLTRLLPAGAACPGPGVTLDFGRDANADGVLSADEVVATQVQCSDVLTGDIEVRTAKALAALAPIRAIVGSLSIAGLFDAGESPPRTVSLPALTAVTGDVRLMYQDSLQTISLPALASVGGVLNVSYNPRLTGMDFSALQRVERSLVIASNLRLPRSPWPALVSVGDLSVTDNPLLEDMKGFSALRSVRGFFQVSGNKALVDCSLALSQLGLVSVMSNDALKALSLEMNPISQGPFVGRIWVRLNPALKTVKLTFPTWTGDIRLDQNGALEQATVDGGRIDGSLDIHDNGALTRLLAPSLQEVSGDLRLIASPLEQLDLSPLRVGGALWVEGTNLTEVHDGEHFDSVGGDASFVSNPRLASLTLGGLGGSLSVSDNAVLSRLSLDSYVLPGTLSVGGNPALESLDAVHVHEIQGELSLLAAPQVERFSLPDLQRVGGGVDILGTGLVDVGLEQLEFIGERLRVGYVAMTEWRGLRALRYVVGPLSVLHNPALQNVDLPRLQLAGNLSISENPSLTRLSLPALAVARAVAVQDNTALPVCEVERLFSQLPPGVGSHQGNDAGGTCAAPP